MPGVLTIVNFPALVIAAMFVGFSYTSARFQYAAARQLKAHTRERKMTKKTTLVRREHMRKMRQTKPAEIPVSFHALRENGHWG